MSQPDQPISAPLPQAGPANPGPPPPPGHPGPPPYGYYPVAVRPPTNGLAIASLAVSCGAIALCGVLAFIGSILGHVARKQIRETGEQGDGLALAGIIVGYSVTGLYVLFIAAYVGFVVIVVASGPN
ncbi:MAG: DUF4190 domain-containing protein [Micromonosporaceae bacterium]|nr:DUF4190 domain-containing protein [Micromonosporaceae bacterium]